MRKKVPIVGLGPFAAIAVMAAVCVHINNTLQLGRRSGQSQVVRISTQTPTLTTLSCGSVLTRFTFNGIVSAALPRANGSFAACRMWLQNSAGHTVTIEPRGFTFNGRTSALTLLPFASAQIWSEGTDWWGRYDKIYTQEQTSIQDGDTVTGPSSSTSFASTVTLPANLPGGTQVRIFADATATTNSKGSPTLRVGTVKNGMKGNLWLCAGDVFANFKGGSGSGGTVDYWLDCNFVIRTSGIRGTVEGITHAAAWIGDCTFNRSCFGNTGNNGGTPQFPGSFFPGYDADSVQYLGYALGDKVLDTTRPHTLYATTANDPNDSYVLRGFTILIVAP